MLQRIACVWSVGLTPFVLWASAFGFEISDVEAIAQQSEESVQGDLRTQDDLRSKIEADITYLASDELKGRETASPGALLASEYLAKQLEAAGLQPGGEDGGFFQTVSLELKWLAETTQVQLTDGRSLTDGIEIQVSVEGPSVKAERVHVVTSAAEVPEQADAQSALYFTTSRTEALEWLSYAGHASGVGFAVLLVEGRERLGRRARQPATGKPRKRMGRAERQPEPAIVRVHAELRAEFAAGQIKGLSYQSGQKVEATTCRNVIAQLAPDSSSPVAEETVFFSAHYDHVGYREPGSKSAPEIEGQPQGELEDLIYNGADDDASGCTTLLALARALAQEPAPDRTAIFFFATGEEKGLLGTEHYLDHPMRTLESTVLNLNFEMLGRPDELVGGPGNIWLTGWERSNLGETLKAAEIPVTPDQRLEQSFFSRSDNYALAKRGIVAQTLSTYNMHADYHTERDEVGLIDMEHLAGVTRICLDASRLVLKRAYQPAWLPGGDPSKQQ